MKKATAWIDGSGNSGRIQACATVLLVDGVYHKRTELLPRHTTNNVGEYSGLLLAIRLAKELGVGVLHIHSDSRLIVEQVNGRWKCKDNRLRELRDKTWVEANTLAQVSIEWIPRERNTEADALCRQAIAAAEASPANPFLQARSHSLPVDIT